jgi:hypothetical protein
MGPTERLGTGVDEEWQGWGASTEKTLCTGMGLVVFSPTLEREVEECKWLGGLAETQHNALPFDATYKCRKLEPKLV